MKDSFSALGSELGHVTDFEKSFAKHPSLSLSILKAAVSILAKVRDKSAIGAATSASTSNYNDQTALNNLISLAVIVSIESKLSKGSTTSSDKKMGLWDFDKPKPYKPMPIGGPLDPIPEGDEEGLSSIWGGP